jgi:hypothetical protein
VDFVFTGKGSGTFNRNQVATRLMNNVVAQLQRTCPRVKLVSAKGVVNGNVVYNAVAESATGWLLLELGSARDMSLLAGGTAGTSSDKGNFARRRDFAGFPALLAATRGRPFLCSGTNGGSCTAVTEFKGASDSGATVVARSLLDGRGTQAVLTYRAQNRSGFLCSNPEQAQIEVIGSGASAAARSRMATDLRERLKPYGSEVCMGYAVRGSTITGANFKGTGARMGNEAVLTAAATMPSLRQGN